jgi:hypothetical protein
MIRRKEEPVRQKIEAFVAAMFAVMLIAGAFTFVYTASAKDYPPSGLGGSPVPVEETATPEPTVIPEETPELVTTVRQLPTTGSGSTAREVVRSEHTYTTVYRYCWKFVPGIWYYAEEVTTWGHSWWGSGHYVIYQTTNTYGRCYIS